MKPSNFIVRIPEPCHEDWNTMQPDAKGKFCSSCSKSVFDFSNKTDIEIRDILKENQGQKVCGHFKKSQIDRPLNIKIDLNNLPKNISITKAFAIALFLVFGTFLFSCTDDKGKKVNEIELVNTAPEEQTLGGLALIQPQYSMPLIDSISGETVVSGYSMIESVPTPEYYIGGDVSYEEGIVLDEVPVIAKENPIIDHVIVGAMSIEYVERVDSTFSPIDSISEEAAQKIIKNDALNNSSSELSIYPNPTSGKFSVKYNLLKRSDVKLDIFDVNGSLIKELVNINSQYVGKYQIPVDLSDLPNGIYIVNLINNGKRTTERVVVER